jgi:hypothetical protein
MVASRERMIDRFYLVQSFRFFSSIEKIAPALT